MRTNWNTWNSVWTEENSYCMGGWTLGQVTQGDHGVSLLGTYSLCQLDTILGNLLCFLFDSALSKRVGLPCLQKSFTTWAVLWFCDLIFSPAATHHGFNADGLKALSWGCWDKAYWKSPGIYYIVRGGWRDIWQGKTGQEKGRTKWFECHCHNGNDSCKHSHSFACLNFLRLLEAGTGICSVCPEPA